MTSVRDVIELTLRRCDVDLEDIKTLKAGSRTLLRVTIDGDGANGRGLSLDEVAEAAKAISNALDETAAMGPSPYVLEVGTRGVDRPLSKPAHYRRNIGRELSVECHDGRRLSGQISACDETSVELASGQRLTYAEIKRGVVQVDFSRRLEDEEDED